MADPAPNPVDVAGVIYSTKRRDACRQGIAARMQEFATSCCLHGRCVRVRGLAHRAGTGRRGASTERERDRARTRAFAVSTDSEIQAVCVGDHQQVKLAKASPWQEFGQSGHWPSIAATMAIVCSPVAEVVRVLSGFFQRPTDAGIDASQPLGFATAQWPVSAISCRRGGDGSWAEEGAGPSSWQREQERDAR